MTAWPSLGPSPPESGRRLLDLDAGDVVPPHAAKSDFERDAPGRGGKVDERREAVYPPGSVLTVPAKPGHWLAARSGPVRNQAIVLDDAAAVPGMRSQVM